jgi:hypothetical protein
VPSELEGSSALVAKEKQCRSHPCGRVRLHLLALKGTPGYKDIPRVGAVVRVEKVEWMRKVRFDQRKLKWCTDHSLTELGKQRLNPCILNCEARAKLHQHPSSRSYWRHKEEVAFASNRVLHLLRRFVQLLPAKGCFAPSRALPIANHLSHDVPSSSLPPSITYELLV